MNKEIYISLDDGGRVKVRGNVFAIDDLPNVEFVVHRPVHGESMWTVSEAITGLRTIRYPMSTQKRAIAEAVFMCSSEENRAVILRAITNTTKS